MSNSDDRIEKSNKGDRGAESKSEKSTNEATENMDAHNKSVRAELRNRREQIYTTARRNFGAPLIVDEKGSALVEGRKPVGANEQEAKDPAKIFKAVLDEVGKSFQLDGGLRLTPDQQRRVNEMFEEAPKDGGLRLTPDQLREMDAMWRESTKDGQLRITPEEQNKLEQLFKTIPPDSLLLTIEEGNQLKQIFGRPEEHRKPYEDFLDRDADKPRQIQDFLDRDADRPREVQDFLDRETTPGKFLPPDKDPLDRFFGIASDGGKSGPDYADLLQRELPESLESVYKRLSDDGGVTLNIEKLRATIDKFAPFDPDGDGIITRKELQTFTSNLDEQTRKSFLDGFTDEEIGAITLLDRYIKQHPESITTGPDGLKLLPQAQLDDLVFSLRESTDAGIQLLCAEQKPVRRVLTNEDFVQQPPAGERKPEARQTETKETTAKETVEHDAKGRISAVNYPDGHSLSFKYDAQGKLAQATDSRSGKVSKFDGFAVVDEQGRLTYYKGNDEHVCEPNGTEIVRMGNGAKTISNAKGELVEVTIPGADGKNTTYKREGKEWTVNSGDGPKPFKGEITRNPDGSITRVDYEAGKLTHRAPDGKESTEPFAREYDKAAEERKQVEISKRTRDIKELFDKLHDSTNPADRADIERALRFRMKEMTKEQIDEMKSKGGFDVEKAIRDNVSKLSYETRVELLVAGRGKEANHTVEGIQRQIDRALAAPNKGMRLELLKEALADQSPEAKQALANFIAKDGYGKVEQVFGKDSPQYPEALQALDKARLRDSSEAEKGKYTISKLFDELREHPKDADAERRLRVYLASLNSEQIKAMSKETGYDLEKELKANKGSLSDSTYAAALDSLRGADKQLDARAVQRRAENALLVADSKQSLQMFEEAFAGDAPEIAAARKNFAEKGGLDKLKQKFGEDSPEYKEAKEFLENGQLKVSTRIERATGAWDAHDSVKLVISQFSEEERKAYLRGKDLSGKNEQNLSADDQRALAFYKETHQALENAASRFNKDGSPERDMRGWEDIIVHGHETLLSKLTQHYANGDDGSVVAESLKTISKEDYDRLTADGGNNEYARQIKKELSDLYDSGDIRRPKDLASFDRVTRELNIVMGAGSFERARTLSGRPLSGPGDEATIEEAITKRKGQGGFLDSAVRSLYGDANAQADQDLLNIYSELRDVNKLFDQLPPEKKKEIAGKLLEAYQVVGSNQEKAAELITQAVDRLMDAVGVVSIATGPEGPVAAGALRTALNFALRKAIFDLAPNLANPLIKAGTLGVEEYRKRPEFGAELAFAALGTLAAATPEIMHLYGNLKTLAKKGIKVEGKVLESAIEDVRLGKDPAKALEKAGVPPEDARELSKSLQDLNAKQKQSVEAARTKELEGRQTQRIGEGRQTQPLDEGGRQTKELGEGARTEELAPGSSDKKPEDFVTRPLKGDKLPATREVPAAPEEVKVPPTREVKSPKSEAATAEQDSAANVDGNGNNRGGRNNRDGGRGDGSGGSGGSGTGGDGGGTKSQDLPPPKPNARPTQRQNGPTQELDPSTQNLTPNDRMDIKEKSPFTQPLDLNAVPNTQEVSELPNALPGDKISIPDRPDLGGEWEVKGYAKNTPEGGSYDIIVSQPDREMYAIIAKNPTDAERAALQELKPGEKFSTAGGDTYSPVIIDGKRYYRDEAGRVYGLTETPNGKILLVESPQYRVIPKEQASKPAEVDAKEGGPTEQLGEGRQTQPLDEGRRTQPLDGVRQTEPLDERTRPLPEDLPETQDLLPPTKDLIPPTREVKAPEDYRTRPLDKRQRAEAETEGLGDGDALPPTREDVKVPPTREEGNDGGTKSQDLPPSGGDGRPTQPLDRRTTDALDRPTEDLDQSTETFTPNDRMDIKEKSPFTAPLDLNAVPNTQEVSALPKALPGDKISIPSRPELGGEWEVKGYAKRTPEGGSSDIIVMQPDREMYAVVAKNPTDAERAALQELKPGEQLSTAGGDTYSPIMIDGKRYYRDEAGRVYGLTEAPSGKTLLLEAPQFRVIPKEEASLIRPMDVEENGAFREIRIGDNETVTLVRIGGPEQIWFFGKSSNQIEADVKIHIPTSGPEDMRKLQSVFIDALQNDPELASRVIGWKTLDPAASVDNPRGVTGRDQGGKAFTIFFSNPEDAIYVQRKLDEIASKKGLDLKKPLDTGNVDNVEASAGRPDVSSNRIGIVRDYYIPAKVDGNVVGAQVDTVLEQYITRAVGVPDGQRLTPEQLASVEQQAGLKPGTLSYDDEGKLMLEGGPASDYKERKGKFYLSEAGAKKEFGKLTDRPAYYGLAKKFLPPGYDPVDIVAGNVPSPKK